EHGHVLLTALAVESEMQQTIGTMVEKTECCGTNRTIEGRVARATAMPIVGHNQLGSRTNAPHHRRKRHCPTTGDQIRQVSQRTGTVDAVNQNLKFPPQVRPTEKTSPSLTP